jgi:hypothetical protein
MAASAGVVGDSLASSARDHHGFEGLAGLDAVPNPSMLTGGTRPVGALHGGRVLPVAAGVLFASVMHAVLFRFQLPAERDSR